MVVRSCRDGLEEHSSLTQSPRCHLPADGRRDLRRLPARPIGRAPTIQGHGRTSARALGLPRVIREHVHIRARSRQAAVPRESVSRAPGTSRGRLGLPAVGRLPSPLSPACRLQQEACRRIRGRGFPLHPHRELAIWTSYSSTNWTPRRSRPNSTESLRTSGQVISGGRRCGSSPDAVLPRQAQCGRPAAVPVGHLSRPEVHPAHRDHPEPCLRHLPVSPRRHRRRGETGAPARPGRRTRARDAAARVREPGAPGLPPARQGPVV